MKFNYQIIIEYLGRKFVGWQTQKNGISVQETIEKALTKTLKTKIKIIGSGRTDVGVNALGQSGNFYTNTEIKNSFKFLSTLNFYLTDHDISVLKLKRRELKFHSRHSAKKREYEYIIINRCSKPTIDQNTSWWVKKRLDIKKMRKAASFFLGTHDFSTFRSSSCVAKSPVRTISKAIIKKRADKIHITFESRSFLQTQVRSMVGCLKYVGESKWSADKIKKILKSRIRKDCAPPAPAKGLFLKKISY